MLIKFASAVGLEVCSTRIKKVDDVEQKKSEIGERTTSQKHHPRQTLHRGNGREEDCRKATEEDRQVPEIHLDYMIIGDETEE